MREIAVERLIFDRSDQQISNQPWSYTPRQLSSAPIRHMGGAGGSYWAICWLFYVQVLFIRHSGPRLYPLTKSVGLQTSSMSCPPTYDAHKNIRWCKTRWCVLRRCGFRRPYCAFPLPAARRPAGRSRRGGGAEWADGRLEREWDGRCKGDGRRKTSIRTTSFGPTDVFVGIICARTRQKRSLVANGFD